MAMSDRELVGVVSTVIHQHRLDGFTSRELAVAILDAIEPVIAGREDLSRRTYRAFFRAQVFRLIDNEDNDASFRDDYHSAVVDVLDLIGEP
jgi:hypothetical protein